MGYEAWEPDADERATASPNWFDCAHCGSLTHRSELADPDDAAVRLAGRCRGPVCSYCAEERGICAECDALDYAEEMHLTDHGLICDDCHNDTPQVRADRAGDERAAIFMEERA